MLQKWARQASAFRVPQAAGAGGRCAHPLLCAMEMVTPCCRWRSLDSCST